MTNSIHEPTPSPLRVRMLEDMKGQRLSGQTQKAYLRSVEKFALFLRRSPETATRDDFRRIQLHFAESQIGSGKINSHVTRFYAHSCRFLIWIFQAFIAALRPNDISTAI